MELLGAITTVLNRAQALTGRMLVDQTSVGKPPVFSGKEEDFHVCAKKVENYVSGVFPNVRGSLSFAVESQDVVTAAAVALGVPELDAETPAETDGQLFPVLSALTDGESFDDVSSAGGDQGFESWRKLHKRWDPHTAGRARSLLSEILSSLRAKLPKLMGNIEKMEDLVRRHCARRCGQGNPHTSADDIRMSSVEHVQLNRARLSATARASTARAKAKGKGQRTARTARTARARTRNNGLLEQEGPDQERWFKWKEHNGRSQS